MKPLHENSFYHIFNRANGDDLLFLTEGDYIFFLTKYHQYIAPIADTFSYCLMPNHFHFLIRIKSYDEISLLSTKTRSIEKYISKQFSNLFSCYAQVYNKQNERKGSLFIKNFKRKEIRSLTYLRKLTHYIHLNPVKAGLCKNPSEWYFSSYHELLSSFPSRLKRQEVINWFEDIENMEHVHTHHPLITGIEV